MKNRTANKYSETDETERNRYYKENSKTKQFPQMEDITYAKQLLDSQPLGRRRSGQGLKKLLERMESWDRNRSFSGITS
jgi:hypothetical protein